LQANKTKICFVVYYYIKARTYYADQRIVSRSYDLRLELIPKPSEKEESAESAESREAGKAIDAKRGKSD